MVNVCTIKHVDLNKSYSQCCFPLQNLKKKRRIDGDNLRFSHAVSAVISAFSRLL